MQWQYAWCTCTATVTVEYRDKHAIHSIHDVNGTTHGKTGHEWNFMQAYCRSLVCALQMSCPVSPYVFGNRNRHYNLCL